ncbi:MAG: hypothetical protein AAFX10_11325, partial [Pseudomonadota bacterium]
MNDARSTAELTDELLGRLPDALAPAALNVRERFRERYPDAVIPERLAAGFVRMAAVSEFGATLLLRDWRVIVDPAPVAQQQCRAE